MRLFIVIVLDALFPNSFQPQWEGRRQKNIHAVVIFRFVHRSIMIKLLVTNANTLYTPELAAHAKRKKSLFRDFGVWCVLRYFSFALCANVGTTFPFTFPSYDWQERIRKSVKSFVRAVSQSGTNSIKLFRMRGWIVKFSVSLWVSWAPMHNWAWQNPMTREKSEKLPKKRQFIGWRELGKFQRRKSLWVSYRAVIPGCRRQTKSKNPCANIDFAKCWRSHFATDVYLCKNGSRSVLWMRKVSFVFPPVGWGAFKWLSAKNRHQIEQNRVYLFSAVEFSALKMICDE